MLSRVADNLYWMSRYLERAEHSARLVNVHLSLMLDTGGQHAERRWTRVMTALDMVPPEDLEGGVDAVTYFLTFDPANRSSIVACIMRARENARQVREQISSEMWEQLNRLFHNVRRPGVFDDWKAEPSGFLHAVKESAYLFNGLAETTMNHGEGWHFIQIGRYIERARALAILLEQYYRYLHRGSESAAEASDYLEWIGLLRACTAFEAYCKVYTADLRPDRIAEFLILNPEFPHSIRFSVDRVEEALKGLHGEPGAKTSSRLQRLAGRLKSSLSFGQIDEILSGGLDTYLEGVQRQCGMIHTSVRQAYIIYPVEAALEA